MRIALAICGVVLIFASLMALATFSVQRLTAQAAPTLAVAADDWPQFRGPAGQGISPSKTAPLEWSADQNVAWKVELPGAGASSPIVLGDRIYLTCYSGYNVPGEGRGDMSDLTRKVVCLGRADGKLLWATEVASRLPDEERIRDDHGYATSTPVADDQRVYAFFGRSGVVALDHDGKQLWHADVGGKTSGWGSAASPILYKNLVIVNASVESESLVALNKETGKEVWRADGIKESWNTPILVDVDGGRTELVVAVIGKILGFDPSTGEQLWSCNTDIKWYMAPSLVAHKGIVYGIGGRTGGALAVRAGGKGDVTRSHRLWTGTKGSNVSSPILYEGHLYWAHEKSGIVYCAKADTGEVLYEKRLNRAGQFYASPVLVGGRLYYTTREGRTFVVAAKPTFELLATNTLDDRTAFNASGAVADGRLLLRSARYLYCLGQE